MSRDCERLAKLPLCVTMQLETPCSGTLGVRFLRFEDHIKLGGCRAEMELTLTLVWRESRVERGVWQPYVWH